MSAVCRDPDICDKRTRVMRVAGLGAATVMTARPTTVKAVKAWLREKLNILRKLRISTVTLRGLTGAYKHSAHRILSKV